MTSGNLTNETCKLNETLAKFHVNHYATIAIYSLFLVLGLLGNFLLVTVLTTKRKLKFASDVYFFNAAIADMFCICMLPAWVQYALESVTLSRFACITFSYGFYISLFLQSWMLILITLERYSYLVHLAPVKRSTAIKRCVWAWLMAVFVASPFSVFRKGNETEECLLGNYTWEIEEPYHTILDCLITILTFIIPVSIVFAYSFKMSRSFWGSKKLNNKTSLILLQLFVVALGFWGPFHLFMFVENIIHFVYSILQNCDMAYLRHLISLLTESLVFLRSVCNPFVYLAISEKFRRQVCGLFQRIPYSDMDAEGDHRQGSPRTENIQLAGRGGKTKGGRSGKNTEDIKLLIQGADVTPRDHVCFL
ncbi:membrane protein US27B [Mandrillus leucophaeus cytomegalovirus]|uniref:Membrane protein US27B n=1 Tax=Mandrillus leucophaeus cytomegalovirus TaxID=1654930 RepID=A0A0G2UPA4_9BETA|nr:membrane protein US27B [Mandrillus leucophaeus cytomegalovirus]AKI29731.1 membrane protein US27B [Mandrillus leucophaeus cytomegalovirus]